MQQGYAAPAGLQARRVRGEAGWVAFRHGGGVGSVQRSAPLGTAVSEYGHEPCLMAAHFVRALRKELQAKNDPNDAEAIATAARKTNREAD